MGEESEELHLDVPKCNSLKVPDEVFAVTDFEICSRKGKPAKRIPKNERNRMLVGQLEEDEVHLQTLGFGSAPVLQETVEGLSFIFRPDGLKVNELTNRVEKLMNWKSIKGVWIVGLRHHQHPPTCMATGPPCVQVHGTLRQACSHALCNSLEVLLDVVSPQGSGCTF